MGRIGWEPAGGREEEEARRPVSPGKRRKPSEFFIGKNSIREREVPVFVIGHPREGRRRAGGACPAQRYPLIQGMVDRERATTALASPPCPPAFPKHLQCSFRAAAIKEINYPATRASSKPPPYPLRAAPGAGNERCIGRRGRGWVEALKEEDREKRGGRWNTAGRRTYLFYTGRSLPPRHRWNPLSSCAPSAENSAFFFRRDRWHCTPPPPDTRQPSMPIPNFQFPSLLFSFTFHFHGINIDFRY